MAYRIDLNSQSTEEDLQVLVGKTVHEVVLERATEYVHFISEGRVIVGAKTEDLGVKAVLFDNDDGIAFTNATFWVSN